MNTEKLRLKGTNWKAQIRTKVHHRHTNIGRKVISTGETDVVIPFSIVSKIVNALSKGHDVHLVTPDGDKFNRFYACATKDLDAVKVASQTEGSFRDVLSFVETEVVRGGQGRGKASVGDKCEVLNDQELAHSDWVQAKVNSVIDATCPNCGTTFAVKVGRDYAS